MSMFGLFESDTVDCIFHSQQFQFPIQSNDDMEVRGSTIDGKAKDPRCISAVLFLRKCAGERSGRREGQHFSPWPHGGYVPRAGSGVLQTKSRAPARLPPAFKRDLPRPIPTSLVNHTWISSPFCAPFHPFRPAQLQFSGGFPVFDHSHTALRVPDGLCHFSELNF